MRTGSFAPAHKGELTLIG